MPEPLHLVQLPPNPEHKSGVWSDTLRCVVQRYAQDTASAALAADRLATPSSRWLVDGEEDPHGRHYECERAHLSLGHLTDDELANGAFMNYDQRLDPAAVLANKPGYHPPIAWMTAVKDRIRWLSRSLEKATRWRPGNWLLLGPDGSRFEADVPLRAAMQANRHRAKVDPEYAAQLVRVIDQAAKDAAEENARLLAQHETLNCPACSGSGHIGDTPVASTTRADLAAIARRHAAANRAGQELTGEFAYLEGAGSDGWEPHGWVVDAMAEATAHQAAYQPLTPREVHDLTCMQAGAPWIEPTLSGLVECIAIYDDLRVRGLRPTDPADARGTLL